MLTKGKEKVDPVDKKAEKKRIAAKVKADFKAGRIPTFRIGGTCEVLPSKALVAQSLGVTPPASLRVQTAVNVSQPPLPRALSLAPLTRSALEFSSESFLSKRRRTVEVTHQRAHDLSVRVPPRHDNRWSFSHSDNELPLVSSDTKIGAEVIRKIGGIGVKFPVNL